MRRVASVLMVLALISAGVVLNERSGTRDKPLGNGAINQPLSNAACLERAEAYANGPHLEPYQAGCAFVEIPVAP